MWKKPENEPTSGVSASGVAAQSSTFFNQSKPREAVAVKAVIGPSIVIQGDVTGEEDLQIDGQINGSISLRDHSVVIGRTGKVKANIHAKVISVDGELTGDLFGIEQVIVHRSGRVVGNITAPRVSLEDGAKLKGTIDMDPRPGQIQEAIEKEED